MLVFARSLDAPTARLIDRLQRAIRQHSDLKLFGWVVFLGPKGDASEAALERQALRYAEDNRIAGLPISVLGDPQGPPGYLIDPQADVTVLFFRSQKVVVNRAFSRGALTPRTAEAVWRELPKLLGN